MKKYFLLLVLAVSASANDCVPLAFHVLAVHSNSFTITPYHYIWWKSQLMPDGNSPTLSDAIQLWNKTQPNNKLNSIYVPGEQMTLTFNKPYLWIGKLPDHLRDTSGDNKDVLHAAILYCTAPGKYRVESMLDDTEKVWLTEYFTSDKELLVRTYFLYEVKNIL